jgi:NOL1/NOP2/sun family putative RNA methylase
VKTIASAAAAGNAVRAVEELREKLTRLYYKHKRQAERLAEEFRSLKLHPHQAARYLEMMDTIELREMLRSFLEKTVPKTIRVNTRLTTVEELSKRLEEKGVTLRRHPYIDYGLIVLNSPHPIGALHEYMLGLYTLQGPASMLAVPALQPRDDARIADMCAGAGVKTTQISQHAPNSKIVAVDVSRRKLLALKNNASRLAAFNIVALKMDARRLASLGKFNQILLDAPCSGEGLLHLDKGRWPRSIDDTLSRVKLQLELLSAAASSLEDGGTIVYSTCTISVEENEYVVSRILETHQELTLEEAPILGGRPGVVEYAGLRLDPRVRMCRRYYPHTDGTEGFTICRLVRKA